MYLDFTHYDENVAVPPELTAFLDSNFHRLPPFDPLLLDFCQKLSQKLIASPDPDLAALGFWLRPAHIQELRQYFITQTAKPSLYVSRGLAFHITASNVDTLFAYSWILSLLVGNGNVVRLPSKQSSAIEDILSHILKLLSQEQFTLIAQSTCLLRYAHQSKITTALSAYADIRIIWGSNETVESIRAIPLNPYAKEITFPDRFSYAVISADVFHKTNDKGKSDLAQAFFRDAYGFDQHGCSSPRLIFWVGHTDSTSAASMEFYRLLQLEITRRGYLIPLSDFLKKQTALYILCANLPIHAVNPISNELTIVALTQVSSVYHRHPGAGLFYQMMISKLDNLPNFVTSQDQTLTHYGFDPQIIEKLARHLNGRGPTRFVPVGEALRFSEIWDGYNLLQELTRCINVNTSSYSSMNELFS